MDFSNFYSDKKKRKRDNQIRKVSIYLIVLKIAFMERTSKKLFLAIPKGIPNKVSVNLTQDIQAIFCAFAIYKTTVPNKIQNVHGE